MTSTPYDGMADEIARQRAEIECLREVNVALNAEVNHWVGMNNADRSMIVARLRQSEWIVCSELLRLMGETP